ncbi:hypothetical protein FN846DRAFT_966527 [Sphaerosporella brunnea]|uniref:F-box domain-containing protein n=1 Tax=Sphaerosporella brunnea TaxID=1250544 RepID=A0A5J5ELH6_9PEZI|nr:hypothetical protein FN846DRAFT_966527 [Sphaerosporella brunnea]
MSSVSTLPIPPELVHQIIRHITVSSDCPSCLQADLSSLTASSRVLKAIATPYLYSSITLSSHHGDSASYSRRMRALQRTLFTTNYGRHVINLQLSPFDETTVSLWASITKSTPNLHTLYGVENFFCQDSDVESSLSDEDGDSDSAALSALIGLSQLRTAVLHDEILPIPLEYLLSNWKNAHILVLGAIVAEGSRFSALPAAVSATAVKELYFHDFELEYEEKTERDDALASLPPLEVLGINDTFGFTLSGLSRFLQQSPAHAQRLQKLEFTRQQRRANPLFDMISVLSSATSLKSVDISLKAFSTDPVCSFPEEVLASNSLEELSYRTIHASSGVSSSAESDFERLAINSLSSNTLLPKLRKLTVACKPHADEEQQQQEAWATLRKECTREGGVLTQDPAELGKNGKRVLLVVEEDVALPTVAMDRVLEMKRGAEGAVVCAVADAEEVNEQVEGKECGDSDGL